MQVTVNFRRTRPTEALRGYALKRIGRLDKVLIKPLDAHMTLAVERQDHIADVVVRADGEVFKGRETAADLYAAIDVVIDKVERQVRRHKEKRRAHRR